MDQTNNLPNRPKGPDNEAQKMLTCQACGKTFVRTHRNQKVACSRACRYQLKLDRARERGRGTDRFIILRRDGFRCRYCGRTPDDGVRLQVDHIHPVSLGGTSSADNLVTACAECNRTKSTQPLQGEALETILSGVRSRNRREEIEPSQIIRGLNDRH